MVNLALLNESLKEHLTSIGLSGSIRYAAHTDSYLLSLYRDNTYISGELRMPVKNNSEVVAFIRNSIASFQLSLRSEDNIALMKAELNRET